MCTIKRTLSKPVSKVEKFLSTKKAPASGGGGGRFAVVMGYQKFTAPADFICSWSLSAIKAINSEFVGLPFVLLTV